MGLQLSGVIQAKRSPSDILGPQWKSSISLFEIRMVFQRAWMRMMLTWAPVWRAAFPSHAQPQLPALAVFSKMLHSSDFSEGNT